MSANCPFCGTDTGIERQTFPDLGSLSLEEFETLVRNEWRRGLRKRNEKGAYRRRHPRKFIRSLILYALAPDSPVRDGVVDQALWAEVAELEVWGSSRRFIQAELLRLSQAIWEVLSRTDLDFDRSVTLMERIDRKLLQALPWASEGRMDRRDPHRIRGFEGAGQHHVQNARYRVSRS